ncbi:EamA family transporter [Pseudaminobacter sp. NGMCC 1.201702]|uniref:EamA family transporter n=1 Tax=Pseudaminobacter sp. NGMCC 1.201702 TaxID=3391825 RepID=UPI0039F05C10
MGPGIFGALSASALGTADFMGRFSSRAVGFQNALLGMLVVGVLLLTLRVAVTGQFMLPAAGGYHWLLIYGVATTVATLLLYMGLARGAVSVVMSIVAAHPVLVVLFYAAGAGFFPSALAMAAMAWTVLGTILVAYGASEPADEAGGHSPAAASAVASGNVRATVLIAVGSSVFYAAMVIAGQASSPIYGEWHTLWYGRTISLITLIVFFAIARAKPNVPLRWWPFIGAQGLLDAGGYMALFAGSTAESREIVTIIASTFGAVAVLLARIILKERIVPLQWFGILLVFSGVVVLSTN